MAAKKKKKKQGALSLEELAAMADSGPRTDTARPDMPEELTEEQIDELLRAVEDEAAMREDTGDPSLSLQPNNEAFNEPAPLDPKDINPSNMSLDELAAMADSQQSDANASPSGFGEYAPYAEAQMDKSVLNPLVESGMSGGLNHLAKGLMGGAEAALDVAEDPLDVAAGMFEGMSGGRDPITPIPDAFATGFEDARSRSIAEYKEAEEAAGLLALPIEMVAAFGTGLAFGTARLAGQSALRAVMERFGPAAVRDTIESVGAEKAAEITSETMKQILKRTATPKKLATGAAWGAAASRGENSDEFLMDTAMGAAATPAMELVLNHRVAKAFGATAKDLYSKPFQLQKYIMSKLIGRSSDDIESYIREPYKAYKKIAEEAGLKGKNIDELAHNFTTALKGVVQGHKESLQSAMRHIQQSHYGKRPIPPEIQKKLLAHLDKLQFEAAPTEAGKKFRRKVSEIKAMLKHKRTIPDPTRPKFLDTKTFTMKQPMMDEQMTHRPATLGDLMELYTEFNQIIFTKPTKEMASAGKGAGFRNRIIEAQYGSKKKPSAEDLDNTIGSEFDVVAKNMDESEDGLRGAIIEIYPGIKDVLGAQSRWFKLDRDVNYRILDSNKSLSAWVKTAKTEFNDATQTIRSIAKNLDPENPDNLPYIQLANSLPADTAQKATQHMSKENVKRLNGMLDDFNTYYEWSDPGLSAYSPERSQISGVVAPIIGAAAGSLVGGIPGAAVTGLFTATMTSPVAARAYLDNVIKPYNAAKQLLATVTDKGGTSKMRDQMVTRNAIESLRELIGDAPPIFEGEALEMIQNRAAEEDAPEGEAVEVQP